MEDAPNRWRWNGGDDDAEQEQASPRAAPQPTGPTLAELVRWYQENAAQDGWRPPRRRPAEPETPFVPDAEDW